VSALNLKADRVYETTVESVHFDKDLGVAKITPESMKSFCRRWDPSKYEELSEYVTVHPETLYLDFESILTGVEESEAYRSLLETARLGDIPSAEHKGFLTCLLVLHAMRSHEMMASMIEGAAIRGLEKWEYFYLLKNAWSSPSILARAAVPLAVAGWTIYRSPNHRFPLCDSPVMIGPDGVMAVLSPRLLLEIDLTVTAPETTWTVRDGMSGKKRSEFRRRAIANSYRDIIFSDPDELQKWRAMPEFRRRVATLSQPDTQRALLREGTSRIIWALMGFGRVPDDFETRMKYRFRA
jgi:hypothetical protein